MLCVPLQCGAAACCEPCSTGPKPSGAVGRRDLRGRVARNTEHAADRGGFPEGLKETEQELFKTLEELDAHRRSLRGAPPGISSMPIVSAPVERHSTPQRATPGTSPEGSPGSPRAVGTFGDVHDEEPVAKLASVALMLAGWTQRSLINSSLMHPVNILPFPTYVILACSLSLT